ncbi:MAG: hypothetical protein L0229_03220 [Blastocatellia bacterium]|nr:hypothetical protein [Blastocatellia bacterium]
MKAIEAAGRQPYEFLKRHVSGDWGDDLGEEDNRENEFPADRELRIFSAYHTAMDEKESTKVK